MKKDNSNIDDIIISFLNEEISGIEREILQKWLAEDSAHKKHFKQLYKIWSATNLLNENKKEVNDVLQRIKIQIQDGSDAFKPKRTLAKRILLNVGRWAAVVIISIGIGAFVYSRLVRTPSQIAGAKIYNEITVPLGSKTKLLLPDGTEVLLNAGSKLTYAMDYGQKNREVELSGEGYFKVAKLKEKPFIVHTSTANIKALGTEFNVKAYPNENIVETILVEGSVVVDKTYHTKDAKSTKKSESIILKPGQKLQIIKNSQKPDQVIVDKTLRNPAINNDLKTEAKHSDMKIVPTDVQIETSWKDKRWIIRGTTLDEIAILLSRKFNVTIQIKDQELKKYKFSGIIENETLEEVFDIMKFTIPIKSTIDKGEVTWSIDRKREKDYKEAY